MPITRNLKDKRIIFRCNNCFKAITHQSIVICDVCNDVRCINCHNKFVCSSSNKKVCLIENHPFRILSNLSSKCFDNSSFTLLEEMIFIDGLVSKGNMDKIAESLTDNDLGKKVTLYDVWSHYFFLNGKELIQEKDENYDIPNLGDVKRVNGIMQKHLGVGGKRRSKKNVFSSEPHDDVVVSYMPKRKEFETEIFNEYESLICTMDFYDYDTPIDISIKDHMLSYYKTIIQIRSIWREFIFSRDLTNVYAWREFERSAEGLAIFKHKWLLQFLSKNDYVKFAKSLAEESYLFSLIIQHIPPSNNNLLNNSLNNNLNNNVNNKQSEKSILTQNYLSPNEKILCKKLLISFDNYLLLKKFAISCLIEDISLKDKIYDLFDPEEKERATVLYEWFLRNNVVKKHL